ncbi:MAG TPA: TetR family transcriptional regulator [Mycobacteriales bacterium]|nr:TetR family transcriptional regulator [Mycobacteriales bacterium]
MAPPRARLSADLASVARPAQAAPAAQRTFGERRVESPEVRERILEAARARFRAHGYRPVTVRSIAAEARVDVALVTFYFGTKQRLFSAAMALPIRPLDTLAEILEGELDTLGERMLRSMLSVWDDPNTGPALRGLLSTAAVDGDQARMVREAVHREIIQRYAARLEGKDSLARAAALTTQVAGVVFARYLLQIEPIASMTADEVLKALAPSLQLIVDGG